MGINKNLQTTSKNCASVFCAARLNKNASERSDKLRSTIELYSIGNNRA